MKSHANVSGSGGRARPWAFASLGAAVLCAGASGCNGGDGDAIPREALTREAVHAICDNVIGCCRDAALDYDAMKCRDRVTAELEWRVAAPLVAYDEEAAGRCIKALSEQADACVPIDYTVCNAAFSGTVPLGGECTTGIDCVPGASGFSVCTPEHRCVEPSRGRPGDVCAYTCIPGPGGISCSSRYQGIAPPSQVACHTSEGLVCAPGQDGLTICQPINSDCRLFEDDPCGTGGFCDDASGACLPYTPVGGSCATVPCDANGHCVNGACVARLQNGFSCQSDEQCQSGRCNVSVCAPFSPAAAAMCQNRR